jgi:hypothetical protein
MAKYAIAKAPSTTSILKACIHLKNILFSFQTIGKQKTPAVMTGV